MLEVRLNLQDETANLLKCHIANLYDFYIELKSTVKSDCALITVQESLECELSQLAKSLVALETSSVITSRQAIACLVKLAEIKSEFIKTTTSVTPDNRVVKQPACLRCWRHGTLVCASCTDCNKFEVERRN